MALPSAGFDTSIYQAPSGDITGFTAKINSENFSADYWLDVNSSDGARARFAKDTGAVEIAFDFVNFDDTGESGWANVFIGNSFAADTDATRTIRAYSPNTRNTAYGVSDTFGQYNAYDQYWKGYWPLDEDPSGGAPEMKDRTVTGADGTSEGSMVSGDSVPGQVGNSLEFNGSNQSISGAISHTFDGDGTTILGWFKAPSSGTCRIFNVGEVSSADDYYAIDANTGNDFSYWARASNSMTIAYSGTTPVSGTWYHMAGRSAAANDHELFLDGASVATNSTALGIAIPWNNFGIGKLERNADIYGPGIIDEVQFHIIARSDEWIGEEYSQTNDNGAFWGTWVFTSVGDALTADDLTSGTPTIEQSTIAQIHEITADDITSGILTIDTSGISQIHALTATELNSGTPTIDLSTIDQIQGLNADDIFSGIPTIDLPTIEQIHDLITDDLASGIPTIDLSTLSSGGVDNLTADDLNSGIPTIDTPIIDQIHALIADTIFSGLPTIDSSAIAQIQELIADGIISGVPTIEQATLDGAIAISETLFFNINTVENIDFDIDTVIEQFFNINNVESIDFMIDTE